MKGDPLIFGRTCWRKDATLWMPGPCIWWVLKSAR